MTLKRSKEGEELLLATFEKFKASINTIYEPLQELYGYHRFFIEK
jgi:hypothetical protein